MDDLIKFDILQIEKYGRRLQCLNKIRGVPLCIETVILCLSLLMEQTEQWYLFDRLMYHQDHPKLVLTVYKTKMRQVLIMGVFVDLELTDAKNKVLFCLMPQQIKL